MDEPKAKRIYSGASHQEVARDLEPLIDFRESGMSLTEIRKLVDERLVPHLMHYENPNFQSMFNAFPENGAKLGAEIALEYNQGVTNWQVSPGGATLEELCIKALCRLFGLQEGSGGTCMYCGTYANQQALYMALHSRAEKLGFDLAEKGISGFADPTQPKVIVSSDAHFSLKHAVRTLGLGEQALAVVDVDDKRRMDLNHLKKTAESLSKSSELFALVATAGTTSTGAVDPLRPISEICQELGIWLHVDGAYGLAYMLVPEWKHLFDGADLADSVSWDPHKQLGIPIPSSLLFARDEKDFSRMALFASYFNPKDSHEPNPGIKSAPSTRPMTALPIVTSILHQGKNGIENRLKSPLVAIKGLKNFIESQPDLELGHQPDTGILCFRVLKEGLSTEAANELQRRIHKHLMKEGERSISVADLDGKTYLRVVAISPLVTIDSLVETAKKVKTAPVC